MAAGKTLRAAKLYVDSRLFGTATEKSVQNTSNIQIIKTDAGNILQLGREDGQFTMNFVIPSGDTGYSELRETQLAQKVVEVQMMIVGDAAHVARCFISELSAQSTTADGSLSANVTFMQIEEGQVIKGFGNI